MRSSEPAARPTVKLQRARTRKTHAEVRLEVEYRAHHELHASERRVGSGLATIATLAPAELA
jgi:hypothetical protein